MKAEALSTDTAFALDEFGDQDETEEASQVVMLTFTLGRQVFAVDVGFVREILDMSEISQFPNAPHDVLGMIDLRGQGIAIIDLAGKLGTHAQSSPDARIIVFEFVREGVTTSLGVVAEKVLRVRDLAKETLEPVPDTLSGWRCDAVEGMVRTDDGIAMVLGIESILCKSDVPGAFDFG
ncbi:MAG: purine-binding chemotaxis protein CheW [Paracoccaceae bacterium]|jgi:purine-binding chemotaxis protein CheW